MKSVQCPPSQVFGFLDCIQPAGPSSPLLLLSHRTALRVSLSADKLRGAPPSNTLLGAGDRFAKEKCPHHLTTSCLTIDLTSHHQEWPRNPVSPFQTTPFNRRDQHQNTTQWPRHHHIHRETTVSRRTTSARWPTTSASKRCVTIPGTSLRLTTHPPPRVGITSQYHNPTRQLRRTTLRSSHISRLFDRKDKRIRRCSVKRDILNSCRPWSSIWSPPDNAQPAAQPWHHGRSSQNHGKTRR